MFICICHILGMRYSFFIYIFPPVSDCTHHCWIRNEATFLNVLYLYLFFIVAQHWHSWMFLQSGERQKTRTCRTSCPAIFLKCFLSAFFQIVDHISTQLPASFVEKLLAPDSKLLKLRFHREQEVAICFCDLVLKWHLHTHIRTDTFICTYVNAYIWTYTHTYVCIYTYTYVCKYTVCKCS